MKKIIFVTGSRAEFDLVVNTLKILDKSNDFNLYVVLTGSHLSQDYGNSYKYIKTYKFKNIVKVDIEVKNSTPNTPAPPKSSVMVLAIFSHSMSII